jgi:DNA-nicking Smr family endonuclease
VNSFAQLLDLKQTLAQQAVAKAEAARIAAAKKAAADKAARLFADTVGEVKPVKPRNLVSKTPTLPAPIAQQKALDDKQVMVDSLSDHFGVEQLLETDVDLSYRAPGIGTDVLNKLRRGDWAIQGQLDLHGLRVEEARIALTEFMNHAAIQGWRCVRVVHGKGLGSKDKQPVLKGRVRSWLVQKQAVIGFVAARPAEGGAGALVVLLASS